MAFGKQVGTISRSSKANGWEWKSGREGCKSVAGLDRLSALGASQEMPYFVAIIAIENRHSVGGVDGIEGWWRDRVNAFRASGWKTNEQFFEPEGLGC